MPDLRQGPECVGQHGDLLSRRARFDSWGPRPIEDDRRLAAHALKLLIPAGGHVVTRDRPAVLRGLHSLVKVAHKRHIRYWASRTDAS